MPTKTATSKLPATRVSHRAAAKPSRASAPAATPKLADRVTTQMQAAATKMLELSVGAIGANRGLRIASSAARALGGGSPAKAAELLMHAVGGLEVSGPVRRPIRAGAVLRSMREAAGFTIEEVGKALDLKDATLLEAFECGRVALSFELILRLAAVVGRNDLVGFIMKVTRTANPDLWRSLEALGIGRLMRQSARGREFANIYCADDAARELSDKDIEAVLAFSKSAFEMALAFRAGPQ